MMCHLLMLFYLFFNFFIEGQGLYKIFQTNSLDFLSNQEGVVIFGIVPNL